MSFSMCSIKDNTALKWVIWCVVVLSEQRSSTEHSAGSRAAFRKHHRQQPPKRRHTSKNVDQSKCTFEHFWRLTSIFLHTGAPVKISCLGCVSAAVWGVVRIIKIFKLHINTTHIYLGVPSFRQLKYIVWSNNAGGYEWNYHFKRCNM